MYVTKVWPRYEFENVITFFLQIVQDIQRLIKQTEQCSVLGVWVYLQKWSSSKNGSDICGSSLYTVYYMYISEGLAYLGTHQTTPAGQDGQGRADHQPSMVDGIQ